MGNFTANNAEDCNLMKKHVSSHGPGSSLNTKAEVLFKTKLLGCKKSSAFNGARSFIKISTNSLH
jgi:hypothetical protein